MEIVVSMTGWRYISSSFSFCRVVGWEEDRFDLLGEVSDAIVGIPLVAREEGVLFAQLVQHTIFAPAQRKEERSARQGMRIESQNTMFLEVVKPMLEEAGRGPQDMRDCGASRNIDSRRVGLSPY